MQLLGKVPQKIGQMRALQPEAVYLPWLTEELKIVKIATLDGSPRKTIVSFNIDFTTGMSTTDANNEFDLVRTAAGWFRDSVRHRGLTRTFAKLAFSTGEFLRDLTPARRRMRFGDLQFDFDHGVNTTWSNVGLKTRVREIFSGEPYQPIEADQFHEMMAAVGVESSNFTFIDMGSGKGRALLLASDYPFRRIVGVEILPELHAIAEDNFRRYKSDKQKCFRLESWCGDARAFEFPSEPTLLYLFNPFFEPVLRDVLAKLEKSLQDHPRKFVVLYANPISEHIVSGAAFLTKVAGTHQYSVYVPCP
jgi:Histone methylation protein DOT1